MLNLNLYGLKIGLIFCALGCSGYVQALSFVSVADPGNPADATGYGAVDYTYRISRFEVTNADYAAMLNAVAASDPHGLYDPRMGEMVWLRFGKQAYVRFGGIVRKGRPGHYAYRLITGHEERPVVFVSWYDAARFTNWLMTGDTEAGAYDTSTFAKGVDGLVDQKRHNPGALCWIPSDDEWYKAGYYNGPDGYTRYATQSSALPLVEPAPGGAQSVNAAFINTYPFLTAVGSYSNAKSYYGTYDQSGNVWEWNEDWAHEKVERSLRGGAFFDGLPNKRNDITRLSSKWRYKHAPDYANFTLGFRVAAAIIPGGGEDPLVERIRRISVERVEVGVWSEAKRIAYTRLRRLVIWIKSIFRRVG